MVTGFNPEDVISSINKVNDAYQELDNALYGKTQNNFVEKMVSAWGSDVAQQFFFRGGDRFSSIFQDRINGIIKGSYDTFQSVVETMNQAAINWANLTGAQWSSMSFSGQLNEVDATCIKDRLPSGGVGVVEELIPDALSELPIIVSESEAALDTAVNAVNNAGFLDKASNQAAALISSLEKIKQEISEVITEETNSINKVIEDEVVEHQQTASTNTETFEIQQ